MCEIYKESFFFSSKETRDGAPARRLSSFGLCNLERAEIAKIFYLFFYFF